MKNLLKPDCMAGRKEWLRRTDGDGEERYIRETACGRFTCDKTGLLVGFETARDNRMYDAPHGYRGDGLRRLIVPEGVVRIGTNFLSEQYDPGLICFENRIIGTVRLPESLEEIGSNVFSRCLIMDMELPRTLCAIDLGAIMCSYVHVLRLAGGMPDPVYVDPSMPRTPGGLSCHGRQFKETIIDTLIAPQGYAYKQLMPEAIVCSVRAL